MLQKKILHNQFTNLPAQDFKAIFFLLRKTYLPPNFSLIPELKLIL